MSLFSDADRPIANSDTGTRGVPAVRPAWAYKAKLYRLGSALLSLAQHLTHQHRLLPGDMISPNAHRP